MGRIIITQSDGGGTVNAARGDTLEFRLPENPSTGYRWALLESGAPRLAPAGDEFQSASTGRAGAGGLRVLQFRAIARGTTVLRLELVRSWETVPPQATFRLQVEVT